MTLAPTLQIFCSAMEKMEMTQIFGVLWIVSVKVILATAMKQGVLGFQKLVDVHLNASDHSKSKDLTIAWIINKHC
jgi:hypothetical protein